MQNQEGDGAENQGEDNSISGQIQKLLTVLRQVQKDTAEVADLEKKKDEFRQKYEYYKKSTLKEKDEKDARTRELDLMKKEKSAKQSAQGDDKKQSLEPQKQKSVEEKYDSLKIMFNK